MDKHITQKAYTILNSEKKPEIINIPCSDLIYVQGKLSLIENENDRREKRFENSVKGIYNNIKETKEDLIKHIASVDSTVYRTLSAYKDTNSELLALTVSNIQATIETKQEQDRLNVDKAVEIATENAKSIAAVRDDYAKQKITWAKYTGGAIVAGFIFGLLVTYVPKIYTYLFG